MGRFENVTNRADSLVYKIDALGLSFDTQPSSRTRPTSRLGSQTEDRADSSADLSTVATSTTFCYGSFIKTALEL
jgi:hypothetical protein